MKFSEALINSLKEVRSKYPSVNLLDRNVLLNNFVFLYHAMKASENLLSVATDSTGRGSPLHEYFKAHLQEEQAHDQWLADDLETAGVDVTKTIVPRLAVEMVGSLYYLIYHVDPAALLGYMAVMECFPMPLDVVEQLETAHGKDLTRTLRYHAENDVDHGADLLAVIDSLPEDRRWIVAQSAMQTSNYFGAAISSFQ